MFYQSVKEWQALPESSKKEKEGVQIYESYFLSGSVFQLNLNDKTLQSVKASFEGDDVPGDVFDTALDEVYQILVRL